MALGSLALVSQELARMQIQVLQRQCAPTAVGREAVQFIRANVSALELKEQNIPLVPIVLRSCATIFQHIPPAMALQALDALESMHGIARGYVLNRYGNVNEASSVLRSIIALDKSEQRLHQDELGEQVSGQRFSQYSDLLHPAYNAAFEKWQQHRTQPHTMAILSLINGASTVFAKEYHFSPVNSDMVGLLPAKSKVEMEAKLQRCIGARELLVYLRGMQFNRLDAGMCLNLLAQVGFYDEEVCNRSCSVLHSSHSLVSSSQMCEVLHSLGVLQHRHVHYKFFSSLVNPKKCNSVSVLRHAQGLAMLQQPPPHPRTFMDGVFLHALRAARRSHGGGHLEQARDAAGNTFKRSILSDQPDSLNKLPPSWYVDMAHALACFNVRHHKFMLMTTRQVQHSIAQLTTKECCKLLYGIGGVQRDAVPKELQDSWGVHVERAVATVAEKLKEIEPENGLQVMRALQYCSVTEHPRVPSLAAMKAHDNPVEIILQAWTVASKERILDLTEQINHCHLGCEPSSKVSEVVCAVAHSCGPVKPQEKYRLGPLCTAVDTHSSQMTIDETLRTIEGLRKMGLASPFQDAVRRLLDNLWQRRIEMNQAQLRQCSALLVDFMDLDVAVELTKYTNRM